MVSRGLCSPQGNTAVQAPQNDLHHNPLLEQGVTRALRSGDLSC